MRFFTFKIFPTRKGKYKDWYYLVHVFHSEKSMYKYRSVIEKNGASKIGRDFLACASAYNSNVNGEEKQFGVLMFTQSSARKSGIAAHEIAHAVNYWWKSMERGKWKKIQDDGKLDEKFAFMLGDCVRQFWCEWYRMRKMTDKKPLKSK